MTLYKEGRRTRKKNRKDRSHDRKRTETETTDRNRRTGTEWSMCSVWPTTHTAPLTIMANRLTIGVQWPTHIYKEEFGLSTSNRLAAETTRPKVIVSKNKTQLWCKHSGSACQKMSFLRLHIHCRTNFVSLSHMQCPVSVLTTDHCLIEISFQNSNQNWSLALSWKAKHAVHVKQQHKEHWLNCFADMTTNERMEKRPVAGWLNSYGPNKTLNLLNGK